MKVAVKLGGSHVSEISVNDILLVRIEDFLTDEYMTGSIR